MTKACDTRQDLVRGLRPLERLRPLVRDVDVASDGRLEFSRAAVHAAAQLLLGERGEPPFHEVHPRSAGRGEVDVKPGMPEQPAMNHRRLVRARIVDDEMDIELCRHGHINRHQEFPKRPRPVALMELTDDFTALGIQGREQRGGPMARVIVRATLDLPGPHRQHGLRPIERLDLGFFVGAQHQRFVGRVEIQAHDVAYFVDKQRVFGELERLAPMRLQPEGPLWMSKSVDPSCSGSDRRSFRFSCWPSPALCARAKLNLGRGDWSSGEELDTSPNTLDLAFYTTRAVPKTCRDSDPLQLRYSLGSWSLRGAWIAKQLWDAEAPTSYLFLVLGAVLWLPAVGFVAYELLRRARDVPTLWRTS
jgi:hypothetical protein